MSNAHRRLPLTGKTMFWNGGTPGSPVSPLLNMGNLPVPQPLPSARGLEIGP
jgi:hypothetical protein